MMASAAFVLAAAVVLVLVPNCSGLRHLLDQPQVDEEGFFTNGRATWFEHPQTGSCGYGKLEPYAYGYDAVTAMPDASAQYPGSCGRCYEVKCRGIQARSADGSVDLDRRDACHDTTTRIFVKVVDTCPCVGNEKWCCGDSGLQHFDLSAGAFSRLAPQGKGIIGLAWRPVPCEAGLANGTATSQAWEELQAATGGCRSCQARGASPAIFMGGTIGLGWKKTVYGDDLQAMYSYEPSLANTSDGGLALCTTVRQYGGFDFNAHDRSTSVFQGATSVEFWVQTGEAGGLPDGFVVRLGDIMKGGCAGELSLASGATQDVVDGWTRLSFSTDAFQCTQGVPLAAVNRIQWEYRSPSKQSICVKDLRIVAPPAPSVAAAGRR